MVGKPHQHGVNKRWETTQTWGYKIDGWETIYKMHGWETMTKNINHHHLQLWTSTLNLKNLNMGPSNPDSEDWLEGESIWLKCNGQKAASFGSWWWCCYSSKADARQHLNQRFISLRKWFIAESWKITRPYFDLGLGINEPYVDQQCPQHAAADPLRKEYPVPSSLQEINRWPRLLLERAVEFWGHDAVRKQLGNSAAWFKSFLMCSYFIFPW